jgi:DVNP family
MHTVGSRAQVMHGTAVKTAGGLTKKDLKYNKNGRIVSRKKSAHMAHKTRRNK